MRAAPGVVCTEIRRPFASHASPFEPLVFSRNVEVAPVSLSMRVMRFAWVSVKIRLPSGSPIGPSVPVKPDLMTSIFVPGGDHSRNRGGDRLGGGGRWCGLAPSHAGHGRGHHRETEKGGNRDAHGGRLL